MISRYLRYLSFYSASSCLKLMQPVLSFMGKSCGCKGKKDRVRWVLASRLRLKATNLPRLRKQAKPPWLWGKKRTLNGPNSLPVEPVSQAENIQTKLWESTKIFKKAQNFSTLGLKINRPQETKALPSQKVAEIRIFSLTSSALVLNKEGEP